jgi:hypothetical protein
MSVQTDIVVSCDECSQEQDVTVPMERLPRPKINGFAYYVMDHSIEERLPDEWEVDGLGRDLIAPPKGDLTYRCPDCQ